MKFLGIFLLCGNSCLLIATFYIMLILIADNLSSVGHVDKILNSPGPRFAVDAMLSLNLGIHVLSLCGTWLSGRLCANRRGTLEQGACKGYIAAACVVVVLMFPCAWGCKIQLYLVRASVGAQLNGTISRYSYSTTARRSVDALHRGFDCCGFYDYLDWVSLYNSTAPTSCCLETRADGRCEAFFARGCLQPLQDHVSYITKLVFYSSDIFFVLLVLLTVVAEKIRRTLAETVHEVSAV